MKIRIVEREEDFDELEAPWNQLSDKTPSSFFSSFDYVRTAWQHFHKTSDRLFLLVFEEGTGIEGIAPFYIERCRERGIPHRAIRFISSWEGDRPRILTAGSEMRIWNKILMFLNEKFHEWEVLELAEQSVEGPDEKGWSFLFRPGWYWERMPDSVDYYISLKGTWEQYLQCLDRNVRHDWQRRSRKLIRDFGPFALEVIVDRALVQNALCRFVAIEQSGWKAAAGVGVAKDEQNLMFYTDLLSRLTEKGQACMCFIKSDEDDLAAIIAFIQKDVIYARHITYSPAYAQYSPGILLLAEFIRIQFGGTSQECDLLGMRENNGSSQDYKVRWAKGRRQTIYWAGYRVCSRMLPLIIVKRVKFLANKTFPKQKADPAEKCRHPQES